VKAIVPNSPGGPGVIELVDRSTPSPMPGQVLIRVHAAGVNRHDINQRTRGHPPPGSTDILGLEVAGEVCAVGQETTSELLGRRVIALTDGGGYAEYAVADAPLLLDWPAPLSAVEAACLPESLFTLWLNLVELGGLSPGELLLIHGGTSGVGMAGIPFARRLGAEVIVTSGSDAKCATALRRGARQAINYKTQDFAEEVLKATAGRGVEVILDTVGGLYAPRNLAALAPDGRVLHLSPSGPDFSVPLSAIMAKRAKVTGAFLRALPLARKTVLADQIRASGWDLGAPDLRPVIDHVFDLADAADAHRQMETGQHQGKIALRVM